MKGPHRWLTGMAAPFCTNGCGVSQDDATSECPAAPETKAARAITPKAAANVREAEGNICHAIIAALVASGRVLVIRDEERRIVSPHRNVQRKTPWGVFGLGVGSPDIIAILRFCQRALTHGDCPREYGADKAPSRCKHGGTFIGIEAKLPSDPTPDDHQLAYHAAVRSVGGIIIVARSVDEAVEGLP